LDAQSESERFIGNENNKHAAASGVGIEIIIPVLNEEDTIGGVIDDISKLDEKEFIVSIVVIDGGSTDDTINICKHKNVKLVVQKGKGKGNAMKEAVEIHTTADIVVFMDGDGTYSVSELKSIVLPLLQDDADMVVGSRMLGKKEKGALVAFNSVGNKIFNKSINFALKSLVTDSLSGYRALYRKTFRELVLFSDSFDIEVEMTVEALSQGYRVLEIPISYGSRKGISKSKLHPINDGVKIAKTLLFILMNVNPLKFFSVIALAFFAAGMFPGAYVLHEKITTGEIVSMPSVVFSSLLFVTGTTALVVGMLSELVVRSRRRLEHLIKKNYFGN
jgi:dolichol-phosphate mannosyltransferase